MKTDGRSVEEDVLYKPVDPKVSFPKMEEDILSFWEAEHIFEKSVEQRAGAEQFIFYDGPPFATGLPHFGHFVPGTIKDIIPRYQTMLGKRVERRFGWDCHGLPVEYEMEKELGISGGSEIEEYGVGKFNEACRSIVLRFTNEWRRIVTRMGRWVDFDKDYKTMDPDYMETIWWVFKRLWEKGLIYEGYYILPYSWALGTPLSNFEVNLGGYHDVDDPAITVRFELVDQPGTYILAWTTTPWTLPSNLALAVGADIEYVRVRDGASEYILAASRLEHYYREDDDYEIVDRFPGKDLVGRRYTPLFPYFSYLEKQGAFTVHAGDFVTTEEGTGIVHIAPGFGEDDYNLLKGSELPVVVPIDGGARFTAEIPDFEGLQVKEADKKIIAWLKDHDLLVRRETYRHPYPFCYRTKTPLIYRAVTSWFVDIEKIKSRMLGANDRVRWVPDHLQKGRMGKWLEGARDWAISRNRFWGNPIPVWKSDSGDHVEVVCSREELFEKSGVQVEDLHKHYVDDITWPAPDGKGTMRRVPEVLDCWFESGAMPFAQNHYPFENKDFFEANFPADFICEGLDQTRGWFYTLTVLAAALFDSPAFENVVVNGLVLAPDGKKMSKSERNYTDPVEVINEFGADALRLFLMHSAVVKAEDLKYTDDGVREVLKTVIIPYWNAYSFFITYANIDKVTPTAAPVSPENPLDRWVLSEAERLVAEVRAQLDAYELQKAIDPIVEFIDSLNNWYIRRSRRRFWKSENDADKNEAYQTLYSVLKKLTLVAAPFIPFIAEEMYQNLRTNRDPISVHLCNYPEADTSRRDEGLEGKMETIRRTVSLGRAIRTMHNLKIRQPLQALHVVTREEGARRVLLEMEDIIREELNVKEVVLRENEEDLVEYSAKANFRELGPRLGKNMRSAAQQIENLDQEGIHRLLEGGVLNIEVDGETIDITNKSVIVQRHEKANLRVLNEGSITVALDPEITTELRREGVVRDLIRQVQNLRKERGLEVTDRIVLQVEGDAELTDAVRSFDEYLSGETLTERLEWQVSDESVAVEIGELSGTVAIRKA